MRFGLENGGQDSDDSDDQDQQPIVPLDPQPNRSVSLISSHLSLPSLLTHSENMLDLLETYLSDPDRHPSNLLPRVQNLNLSFSLHSNNILLDPFTAVQSYLYQIHQTLQTRTMYWQKKKKIRVQI